MCELLGMSASVPTDICFSFAGLIGLASYRIYETADGRHLTVAPLEPVFFPGVMSGAVRLDHLPRHALVDGFREGDAVPVRIRDHERLHPRVGRLERRAPCRLR